MAMIAPRSGHVGPFFQRAIERRIINVAFHKLQHAGVQRAQLLHRSSTLRVVNQLLRLQEAQPGWDDLEQRGCHVMLRGHEAKYLRQAYLKRDSLRAKGMGGFWRRRQFFLGIKGLLEPMPYWVLPAPLSTCRYSTLPSVPSFLAIL
jgi:hypothetical protein